MREAEEATDAVRELTTALHENAEFYRAAAASAAEHDLREALRGLAEQRALFAEELGATPAGAVADVKLPNIGESAAAGMKRGAMTIKAGLALQPARIDTIVVEGSADMEQRLAEAYRRALRRDLSAHVRAVAARQLEQIEAERAEIDAAVETARSTSVGTPVNPTGSDPADVRPAVDAGRDAALGDKLVLGVFPDQADAERSAAEIAKSGLPRAGVRVITQLADARQVVTDRRRQMAGSAAGVGATVGTVLGIIVGAIAGFGAVGVEEVQGALRSEALWSALAIVALGSGVGALIGAVLAGIVGYSVGESTTQRYLSSVDRGETLVAVRAPQAGAARAAQILHSSGAHSVRIRTPDSAGLAQTILQ